jgi:hypothetical protein
MFWKLPPVLETGTGFGNSPWFWKLPPVLETGTGFGNYPHFPKLPPVLETPPSFGNRPRFWKLPPVLETGTGFGNHPHFWKPSTVLETIPTPLGSSSAYHFNSLIFNHELQAGADVDKRDPLRNSPIHNGMSCSEYRNL